MTEQEWLACDNPGQMLDFLRETSKVSSRKLRLFACACCRLIWTLPNDDRARHAVEAAEKYVDGLGESGLIEAYLDLNQGLMVLGRRYIPDIPAKILDSAFVAFLRTVSCSGVYYGQPWEWSSYNPYQCAADAAHRVASVAAWVNDSAQLETARAEAGLLRDIIGNPFRRLPAVKAGGVAGVAEAAYEGRELPVGTLINDRLAALATAFKQAGCDNEEIWAHLRGPGPHVRGCHVVDLLLNRQ